MVAQWGQIWLSVLRKERISLSPDTSSELNLYKNTFGTGPIGPRCGAQTLRPPSSHDWGPLRGREEVVNYRNVSHHMVYPLDSRWRGYRNRRLSSCGKISKVKGRQIAILNITESISSTVFLVQMDTLVLQKDQKPLSAISIVKESRWEVDLTAALIIRISPWNVASSRSLFLCRRVTAVVTFIP